MAGVRKIGKIKLPNLEPNRVVGSPPECILVDPLTLYVEEDYQRTLGENSIKLIRKLVRGWNWAHTKPPICVRDGERLLVVDGQHTAIAAASHPDIGNIPVMIVNAAQVQERARAFVAHNTSQVRVTPMQIFFAELAAGDEIAKMVDQSCAKAKVKILRYPPAHGIFRPGETLAISSLRHMAAEKGIAGLVRVLRIMVEAGRGPIKKTEMAAVFAILYSPQFRGSIDDYDLASVIRSKSISEWERSVAERREIEKIPLSKALAEAWLEGVPKVKKVA